MSNNNELKEKCSGCGGACGKFCAYSFWYGALNPQCRARMGVPFVSPWEAGIYVERSAKSWTRGGRREVAA